MKTATGPDRVGVHLLDGSHRYGLWVTIKRGADGQDQWELMSRAVTALYAQLVEDGLSTRNLPSGDEGEEVAFAGGLVLKVVVENQWSGNQVPPTYPF